MEKKRDKLRLGEILSYGQGFLSYGIVSVGFTYYLTYFWSDIMIIPLAAISLIFLLSRFLDGVTDIMIGFWVDNTKSKYGKARPWLLWMALPTTITFALLFYTPNLSMTGKIIWAAVMYNLVAFFFMTCAYLPMQALTSKITQDAHSRVTLNMVGWTFSTIATVLGFLYVTKGVAALGGGQKGYFTFFGILAVIAGLTVLGTFLGTKERVFDAANKQGGNLKIPLKLALKSFIHNKWWIIVTLLNGLILLYSALMAMNVYYMKWYLKNPAFTGTFMSVLFGAMFVALIVLLPVINKMGKIKAGFFGEFIQIIGGLLPLISPLNTTLLLVSAAFRGIGPAILLGTRLAYSCDVIEYGEWKTGVRLEGLIFSGASFGSKVGAGIGAAIVSMMLAYGGYVGGAAVQPQSALNAILFTFTWLGALCSAGIAVCLFLLRGLEKQMPQIMKDLKEKKSAIQ